MWRGPASFTFVAGVELVGVAVGEVRLSAHWTGVLCFFLVGVQVVCPFVVCDGEEGELFGVELVEFAGELVAVFRVVCVAYVDDVCVVVVGLLESG